MEVDEELSDSTDPVEDALPAPGPETKLTKVPVAGEDALPNPDGACFSIVTPPEEGPGLYEGSRKNSPHREQVGETRAEEEPIPIEETLEPREMDATPAVAPPSPDMPTGAGKRVTVAEHHGPTPEGYVTPTGVLSATGSPMRPRASPKRKQLSSPEGTDTHSLKALCRGCCNSPCPLMAALQHPQVVHLLHHASTSFCIRGQ